MTPSTAPINVPRKRLLSMGDDSLAPSLRKRPRLSSITSTDFQIQLMGGSASANASVLVYFFSRPSSSLTPITPSLPSSTASREHARSTATTSAFSASPMARPRAAAPRSPPHGRAAQAIWRTSREAPRSSAVQAWLSCAACPLHPSAQPSAPPPTRNHPPNTTSATPRSLSTFHLRRPMIRPTWPRS